MLHLGTDLAPTPSLAPNESAADLVLPFFPIPYAALALASRCPTNGDHHKAKHFAAVLQSAAHALRQTTFSPDAFVDLLSLDDRSCFGFAKSIALCRKVLADEGRKPENAEAMDLMQPAVHAFLSSRKVWPLMQGVWPEEVGAEDALLIWALTWLHECAVEGLRRWAEGHGSAAERCRSTERLKGAWHRLYQMAVWMGADVPWVMAYATYAAAQPLHLLAGQLTVLQCPQGPGLMADVIGHDSNVQEEVILHEVGDRLRLLDKLLTSEWHAPGAAPRPLQLRDYICTRHHVVAFDLFCSMSRWSQRLGLPWEECAALTLAMIEQHEAITQASLDTGRHLNQMRPTICLAGHYMAILETFRGSAAGLHQATRELSQQSALILSRMQLPSLAMLMRPCRYSTSSTSQAPQITSDLLRFPVGQAFKLMVAAGNAAALLCRRHEPNQKGRMLLDAIDVACFKPAKQCTAASTAQNTLKGTAQFLRNVQGPFQDAPVIWEYLRGAATAQQLAAALGMPLDRSFHGQLHEPTVQRLNLLMDAPKSLPDLVYLVKHVGMAECSVLDIDKEDTEEFGAVSDVEVKREISALQRAEQAQYAKLSNSMAGSKPVAAVLMMADMLINPEWGFRLSSWDPAVLVKVFMRMIGSTCGSTSPIPLLPELTRLLLLRAAAHRLPREQHALHASWQLDTEEPWRGRQSDAKPTPIEPARGFAPTKPLLPAAMSASATVRPAQHPVQFGHPTQPKQPSPEAWLSAPQWACLTLEDACNYALAGNTSWGVHTLMWLSKHHPHAMASEEAANSATRLLNVLGKPRAESLDWSRLCLPVPVCLELLPQLSRPELALAMLQGMALAPQGLGSDQFARLYEWVRSAPLTAAAGDVKLWLAIATSQPFLVLLQRSAPLLPEKLLQSICSDFVEHAPASACLAMARALQQAMHLGAVLDMLSALAARQGFTQHRELMQTLDPSHPAAHPTLRSVMQQLIQDGDHEWLLERLPPSLQAGFQPEPKQWLQLARALWPLDGQTMPQPWLLPVVLSSLVRQLLSCAEAEPFVISALAAAAKHRLCLGDETLLAVLKHCGQEPNLQTVAQLELVLAAMRCALQQPDGPSTVVCERFVQLHTWLQRTAPPASTASSACDTMAVLGQLDTERAAAGAGRTEVRDLPVTGRVGDAAEQTLARRSAAMGDVQDGTHGTSGTTAQPAVQQSNMPEAAAGVQLVQRFEHQLLLDMAAVPVDTQPATCARMIMACSRHASHRLLSLLLRWMEQAAIALAPDAAGAVLQQASPPLPPTLATAVFERSISDCVPASAAFPDAVLLAVVDAYHAQGKVEAAFRVALSLGSAAASLNALKQLRQGLARIGQDSACVLAMLGAALDAENVVEVAQLLQHLPVGAAKQAQLPQPSLPGSRHSCIDASLLWYRCAWMLAAARQPAAALKALHAATQHAQHTGVAPEHDWLAVLLLLACERGPRRHDQADDALQRLCSNAASAGLLTGLADDPQLALAAAKHGHYAVALDALHRSQDAGLGEEALRKVLRALLPDISRAGPGLVPLLAFAWRHEEGWADALSPPMKLVALAACHAAQLWDLAAQLYTTLKTTISKAAISVEARSWGLEALVRVGLMDKAKGIVSTWAVTDWPNPKVYFDTIEVGAAYALALWHGRHVEDALKVLRQLMKRFPPPRPAWVLASFYATSVSSPYPAKALVIGQELENGWHGSGPQADIIVVAAHLQLCAAADDASKVGKLVLDYSRAAKLQESMHGCCDQVAERHQLLFASATHALYCLGREDVLPQLLEAVYSCGVRRITYQPLVQAVWTALSQPSALADSRGFEQRMECAWPDLSLRLMDAVTPAEEEDGAQQDAASQRRPWGPRDLHLLQRDGHVGTAVDLVPDARNRIAWDQVEKGLGGLRS